MGLCFAIKGRPFTSQAARRPGGNVSVKFLLADVSGVQGDPITGLTENQVNCDMHAKLRLL